MGVMTRGESCGKAGHMKGIVVQTNGIWQGLDPSKHTHSAATTNLHDLGGTELVAAVNYVHLAAVLGQEVGLLHGCTEKSHEREGVRERGGEEDGPPVSPTDQGYGLPVPPSS